MRKVFKKTIASVVAGVTLVVGMTAMSSSAADGKGGVYNGSTRYGNSYNSVSTSSVWVKTESTVGNVSEISAKITAWNGTLNGSKSLTYADSNSVSFSCSATGTTQASSSHTILTYEGVTATGTLTVYR